VEWFVLTQLYERDQHYSWHHRRRRFTMPETPHPATEHHEQAAEHLKEAAKHHELAAEQHGKGEPEKAAEQAHHAQGHATQAMEHAEEAAKAHATDESTEK